MPARSLAAAAALAMVMVMAGGGCADSGVSIAFRPEPGDRFRYEVEVETVSVLDVAGRRPVQRRDAALLRADHRVLATTPDGSRVRVRLTGPALGPRVFDVRLDRAGQLVAVERVEGLPAGILGDLGPPELFPSGAAAVPDRHLRPGERWRVAEAVRLPGAAPTELTGRGRLARLEVRGGRQLAAVETVASLRLRRTTTTETGAVTLDGIQHTALTVHHDLADGAVETAAGRTRARYDVALTAPGGGATLTGSLTVEIRSTTRRLR